MGLPFPRDPASREELMRDGALITTILIRDTHAKGQEVPDYLDDGNRLHIATFAPYFERKRRLLPKPSDLSFYRDTQNAPHRESPTFQHMPDYEQGALFENRCGRQMINNGPKNEPGDNARR